MSAPPKDVERVLRRAAGHIFEDLCFASVDHGAHDAPAAWDIVSSVAFEGEFAGETKRGALVLRLFHVDPAQLAEAMLGDGEELDEALALDAVGELTNVVCGNVLPDVVDLRATFDLRHPEVTRMAGSSREAALGGESVRVLVGVEEGLAEVELVFFGAAVAAPEVSERIAS